MAKKQIELITCDRCSKEINKRWFKQAQLSKMKRRLMFGEYVSFDDLDLCQDCIEDFETFMDNKI